MYLRRIKDGRYLFVSVLINLTLSDSTRFWCGPDWLLRQREDFFSHRSDKSSRIRYASAMQDIMKVMQIGERAISEPCKCSITRYFIGKWGRIKNAQYFPSKTAHRWIGRAEKQGKIFMNRAPMLKPTVPRLRFHR